jgi:hypothetical protein
MPVLAVFSTPIAAHLLVSRLASAGITAQVRDELTVTFNGLLSDAIGEVKGEVALEDLASAQAIWAMAPTEAALLMGPHCGSGETRVRTLRALGAFCILFKIPIPMTRATLDCRAYRKTHDVSLNGRE